MQHGGVGAGKTDAFLRRLEAVVGSAHVLTDPDVTAPFAVDWTGRFQGDTPAVVRPADAHEVSAVLRLCADADVAVVPQGGNTGLVGGSVPLAGEIVLSLRRLARLGAVDGEAMQLTAGAGCTVGDLQRHAAAAGLAYGVDLASRDSATVGGTVATNAGGIHLLRFGGTRRQLLGVEAVLADGSVVSHLDGLPKDNTGYDLAGLMCGSEGTLGVLTAARFRLVPRYECAVVALVAFDAIDAAVSAVAACRRKVSSLHATEMFLGDGLALVCQAEGLAEPFARHHDVYVLIEAADHVDPTDVLAAAVESMAEARDVAVASDAARRHQLCAYREQHTAAINTLGPPHKLDVTLPMAELARFVGEVRQAVASVEPEARTWLFGHVADGNLHVNVTGTKGSGEAVDDVVLRLVASRGGSISAEHGIGTAKKRWLHLNRSPAEIAMFRRIKAHSTPRESSIPTCSYLDGRRTVSARRRAAAAPLAAAPPDRS